MMTIGEMMNSKVNDHDERKYDNENGDDKKQ